MKSSCRACSRRGFLRRLLPLGVVAGFATVRLPAAPPEGKIAIPLAKLPQLKDLGGGVLLRGLKGRDVLIIRTAKTRVAALFPECTHRRCDVFYEKEWGEIRCECHGSKFSVEGEVINPPAKKPLRRYAAELQEDRIILDLNSLDEEKDPEPADESAPATNDVDRATD